MSVNAATGHSGRATQLLAATAFTTAKPVQKRMHEVAPEVKQAAFVTAGRGKAAEGNIAGSTLDVKL